MRALILAAGYGTRLYPLTLDKPKALLDVAGKPIIQYIIEKLNKIRFIDEIIVVTNDRFYNQFKDWAQKDALITLINNGTTSQENRLGAIKDIDLVVRKCNIKDDILVIGGDNLFENGLAKFLRFAVDKSPASSVGLYDIQKSDLAKQYGCVELDRDSKIIRFEEKSCRPLSTLAAMCLYYISAKHLKFLEDYINKGDNLDAPGHFIKWLALKDSVYGYIFDGAWFDIGDIDSYEEAVEKIRKEKIL